MQYLQLRILNFPGIGAGGSPVVITPQTQQKGKQYLERLSG